MTHASNGHQVLRLNGLRIQQRDDVPLYVFGVDGRMVHRFAAVDSAARGTDGVLQGYQRDRVKSHINQIFRYLEGEDAILPNAIVVAFDERVEFTATPGIVGSEWGTLGRLEIPLPGKGDDKAAYIVDGQQRASALALLDPERNFPVVVVGFQATSEETQRQQFVLVNRTKPLPRDLLNELLPHVGGELPTAMTMRRVSGQVLEILRFDQTSPFYGRVRGLGASVEGCNISQASVLGMIEANIRRGGSLADDYYAENGPDVAVMARQVHVFYTGIARTWPYAWGGSPWTSRLVHGVGIAATGMLMDDVMLDVRPNSRKAISATRRRLKPLKNRCAWTEGRWPKLRCEWNELQNTSQDKRRLGGYLRETYRASRGKTLS